MTWRAPTKLWMLLALSMLQAATLGSQPEPRTVRLLTDFTRSSPELGWHILDDTVMGGRSEGSFERAADGVRFWGRTNTRGGGFSSLRTEELDVDLSSASGIRVVLKGDGRRYTWRLTTDERKWGRPVSYLADIGIVGADWREIDIPFSVFRPRFRGADLDGPPLDASSISGMGLMIYDGENGPFEVLLKRVEAYAAE